MDHRNANARSKESLAFFFFCFSGAPTDGRPDGTDGRTEFFRTDGRKMFGRMDGRTDPYRSDKANFKNKGEPS